MCIKLCIYAKAAPAAHSKRIFDGAAEELLAADYAGIVADGLVFEEAPALAKFHTPWLPTLTVSYM
jgi:hypothetical protein